MKLWGRIWKDNHVLRDTVAEETSDDTRTHRIFRALETLCLEFDLGKPIWLDVNIRKPRTLFFFFFNFIQIGRAHV